jgi:1,4-dihydroxy-6-naphthoate synthase
MVNGKIPVPEFEFEPVLEDVETLNQWAMEGRLDITKLSFPAFFQNQDVYDLLDAGAALGKGVGPLLVSANNESYDEQRINNCRIAIPGLHTTANLLLRFAFPDALNKIPLVFSSIEESVLSGKAELGVIIHENRFTYEDKGLHKVADLGELWEKKMQVPVPLGCIAIKKVLGKNTRSKIEELLRQSIDYAFSGYPVISGYVKQHAQAMSETVMRKHIELYVNEYTKSLGEEGRQAIEILKQQTG